MRSSRSVTKSSLIAGSVSSCCLLAACDIKSLALVPNLAIDSISSENDHGALLLKFYSEIFKESMLISCQLALYLKRLLR